MSVNNKIDPKTAAALDKFLAEAEKIIAESKATGGPQTPEGKAVSRMNALKHGFNSDISVVPGEDAAEFTRVLRELRTDHRPRTSIEDQCLQQMAHANWKLLRAAGMEKAMWSIEFGEKPNEDCPFYKMAAALMKNSDVSGTLAKIHRYESSARRAYHQAEAAFRRQHSYTLQALDADREMAAKEGGDMGVVSVDAIAFLRFLELRNLTVTSHLATTPAPGSNGTNSPAAEVTPGNSE